ncbi:hypothetical protein [Flagellimonas maritima]|uniref:hypothetical protein n=1 Tax=Flagellimonas maritima TaxID=1383885 RepID=UPI0013DED472|nr:hypothetical protein [Allomuricauda aurantiaca]
MAVSPHLMCCLKRRATSLWGSGVADFDILAGIYVAKIGSGVEGFVIGSCMASLRKTSNGLFCRSP